MAPSAVPPAIAAGAAGSAAADLAAPRAAPGRGTATTPQGGSARQRMPAGTVPLPQSTAVAADAEPDSSARATPAAVTFGQTLAASMSASSANPQHTRAAPARGTAARKPTAAPVSPSPAMILASLPATGTPTTAADPTPVETPRADTASPETAASAVSAARAAPGGTPAAAATASALQGLALTLPDDDASSEAPAPETGTGAPAAAPDAGSARSGGAAAPAAALLAPAPTAAPLTARVFQSPGKTSDSTATEDAPAAPAIETGAGTGSPPRVEQIGVAAASPGGAGDGAQAAPGSTTTSLIGATPTVVAAQASAPPATPTSAAPAVQVQAQVGTSAWAHELGMRLHLLAQQGISSASLRLTPAQLGPVEVSISMRENAASVWFGSAHPDTRSALEQALPKLRELFASQGLNLTHAGVSDQSARGARREPQPAPAFAPAGARGPSETQVTPSHPPRQGLIDTYA